MWNDADASPPPPPTFRASSEIDVVENELVQGTPNLEFEIRDLIESLKEQGITSRALLASFAEKHTPVLEYMCKTALGARDMDKVPLSLMIGAAALVTRLAKVNEAGAAAPRRPSAGEPSAKRPPAPRAEPWLGNADPKIESAYDLHDLPEHLRTAGLLLQEGRDEVRPLTVEDALAWVDSARFWLIKQGIVNHVDSMGVLKKVRGHHRAPNLEFPNPQSPTEIYGLASCTAGLAPYCWAGTPNCLRKETTKRNHLSRRKLGVEIPPRPAPAHHRAPNLLPQS